MRRPHQHGFTLIELLLVLAIIAALAVAAFINYPRVQAGRAAQYESELLSAFQASMKGLFTTGDYSKVTTAVTAGANMWPASMWNSPTAPTAISNEWGGTVTVSPSTADGAASATTPATYFTVSYAAVPYDVCQKLLPNLIANWPRVAVGTTVVQDTISATTTQYDPSAVATACGSSAEASAGGVTLTLTSN